ncbi:MAG: TraR/DksA family transcriptional regulator [Mesorhizobium sp.]|uniref:TraR/DksA C4-type zinc finger protein n=1 Tax=Mesorhizobium sp. TaxID=1871066 RepID=UPI000FD294C3|nr:TraR/DksA C4-type zinc finger protein [Mesorhizobium sp.]RUU46472.1 TraR/DksA family transcriptional regulator [Mesorhizobium sp. M6A.T.Ca.TU.002.02.2.1]RWO97194.1 MAG: TraR/DksA family transcriptional regulator [Mesorhizobium sp.]TIM52589.1 MAG: TraR/DksA family transcriptional regulator [Mesorhizobium sp.]
MTAGNAAIDLAERRVEQECAAGVARIQAAIREQYAAVEISPFCDCGERIPDARRHAVPNCTRCIDCETFIERQSRRRA